jgi:hypothetical protein
MGRGRPVRASTSLKAWRDHPIQGEFRGAAVHLDGAAAAQVGQLIAQVRAQGRTVEAGLEGGLVASVDRVQEPRDGARGVRPGPQATAAQGQGQDPGHRHKNPWNHRPDHGGARIGEQPRSRDVAWIGPLRILH